MVSIDVARIDTMAFDLDGVVTKTAAVHAAAWKRLFDELLERSAAGGAWTPFDIDRDYRTYVDGKPRRDGIRSFLASRDIRMPDGHAGDGPDATTIHGLAERKNGYLLAHLARAGVEVYDDAVRLIHAARLRGVKRAVVTASENCDAVLAAAGLTGLFEVQVDGRVASDFGLRGKPAPDTFLEAVRRLGTSPERAIVFEDAIAGVRAGQAGGFALVVGVDRTGHADELRGAGADAVVSSLDEIELSDHLEARL